MIFAPDELRMIGLAGHIWLRMLRSREENIIARMYGEFRSGKTDFVTSVAELACVRDQITEIKNAISLNENQKE